MQRRRARRLQSRRPPYVHARKRATLQASIQHDHQRLLESGIRQSAMALIKITGMHPNLAAGFHHVSRAASSPGNEHTSSWQRRNSTANWQARPAARAATTTQWPTRSAISIFECSNITLKALRSKLGIKSLATQLTAEVSRHHDHRNNGNASAADNNNSNCNASTPSSEPRTPTGTRLTRATAAIQADASSDPLLGHRLATSNASSTTAASTPPPPPLLSLRNWQPVKGLAAHNRLRKAIDDVFANCHADTERRQTKIQKEH